jgi:hypothetical protein
VTVKQVCQAVSTSYDSRWPHSYDCGKPAKVVMQGREHKAFGNEGPLESFHLCGVHAMHARKGRSIGIATGGRSHSGPHARSITFEATPLEALKNELAALDSRWTWDAPTPQYTTIGTIIYANADALESIIAALPVEQAQALMTAVETTDASVRDKERRENRKAELIRLIDEAKERGEK